MGINFTDIMKKIIGVDELKDFAAVEEKLADYGEGYIFQNNKPTHVIMTLEKYESLSERTSFPEPPDTSVEGLDTFLNKIGKKIFIDYYDVFKTDNNPESALEAEGFTLASRRSRSSSARSIFKNSLQIAALNNIIFSERIDMETVNKAQSLLARENGYASSQPEKNSEDEDDQYCVKIGKMMRGVLTKLLKNYMISGDELIQMQFGDYSKAVFNLNFPVLKAIRMGQTSDEAKRDAKGYNRYYDNFVSVNGTNYLICSQWVENLHKKQAEKWIVDKMADIVNTIAAGIPVGDEFSVREVLSDYWPHINWSVRKRIGLKYKEIAKKDSNVEFGHKSEHGQIYRKVQ